MYVNVRCAHVIQDTGVNAVPEYGDTLLQHLELITFDSAGNPYGTYATTATSTFSGRLSSSQDTAVWVFRDDTTAATPYDTLIFHYQRKLTFLSNACGYTYFYNLTSVTRSGAKLNSRDSVLVENPDVTNNVNVEHIKLYY
jgi:hypothetical protein